MIVEGYVLHLSCDARPVDAHSSRRQLSPWSDYEGISRAKAWRDARADGWVRHRDGSVTCPECNPRAAQRGREDPDAAD